jgi:hypothetical protein
MARVTNKTSRKSPAKGQGLSVADQLFAITTHKYSNAAAEFLPSQAKADVIAEYQNSNRAALAGLKGATASEPAKAGGRILSGTFGRLTTQTTFKIISRAALFVVAIGAGLTLISFVADDTIRIEDELGKSALNSEFGGSEKSVSLHVMRKRKKIGEFTVAQGSKLRVVKASNGDAFRSEVAFAGTEADFKLKYKGKASVIVNNGPFKAKVRIAQGADNDVHLRFKELGNLLPVGEPKFSIEVIKGDVQIAEVDDDDEFEQYKAGEKAIFSLSDSESL